MLRLKVVEWFVSWQGEGVSVGRRAFFFRFPGCNLRCPWCDTKYAWTFDELVEVEFPLKMGYVPFVVITGGEPLADWNREQVMLLVRMLEGVDRIEIETNGTYPPLDFIDGRIFYVVSPKPEYVVGCRSSVIDFDWLGRKDVYWKFVLGSSEDEEFIRRVVNEWELDKSRVYVMPRGQSLSELSGNMLNVVRVAEELGVNISTRLHILGKFR